MSEIAALREEALEAELSEARRRLDGLVRDLRGVDGEIEGISTEREHYRLLQQVCGGLEELRERPLFPSCRAEDLKTDFRPRLAAAFCSLGVFHRRDPPA